MDLFWERDLAVGMTPSSRARARAGERRMRILIADDHPVIRRTVREILEAHPRWEVIGEVEDGLRAVEEAEKLKPDVVVLNVTMPVMNGLEAAREIKAKVPESVIVILSSHADARLIEDARRVGARAYVAKTKAARDLVAAIMGAVGGGDFVLMD
jgi:DNA-binding NarL/FixJ family response regulator